MHVEGGGDNQSELVDESSVKQSLGERDAAVHADLGAGSLLQIVDECSEVAVDDVRASPTRGRVLSK